MLKLHDYQQRAVDLTVKYGNIYHMLDAGLGKTAIALKAIERVGLPALVFGPKLAMTHTWPEEIEKWTPQLTYTALHGTNKEHYARLAAGCDITLLNYEGLKWFIDISNRKGFKLKKFFIVLDESSMIKYRGKGTAAGNFNRFEMMQQIMPIFSPYRIALSATPVPTSLINLWPQYYMLDSGKRLTPSFYDFRNRYFSYSGAPHYKTELLAGADEKLYNAIMDITFQLNAEDHLKMPPLVQNIVRLPMPKKLRKMYDQMDAEYIINFKDGDVAIANSQATAGNKLRQLLQGGVYSNTGRKMLKSPAKAQYLKEFVENSAGNPVMCAIQFQFEYDIICEVFKEKLPLVAGKTQDAGPILRKWKQGKLPLMLVHPGSVGYSLNLQSGGHTLVWLALPWSFEHYYQLVRRLYRQGQKQSVLSHAVCFGDTVDEAVARNLQTKFKTDSKLKKAMGERGLQL